MTQGDHIFPLQPERDVDTRDGCWVATGTEPWLALDPAVAATFAGRFVDLIYRASLWDEPARPVFRFWTADGRYVDRIAAGPIAGAGIWTGRVPRGTVRISVSPTNRLGRFDFRIEQIRPRAWAALLAEGFRKNARSSRSVLLARLIGWNAESDVNLTWATAAVHMRDYAAWHEARSRPIELDDLDRPRFDWTIASPVHITVTGDDPSGLAGTLASLRAQLFLGWTATIASGVALPGPDDPRIGTESPEGVFNLVLRAGDILMPGALAYLAEQAHRHPDCRLFYADALVHDRAGRATPALQPGWSPRLFAARGFGDALLIVRDLQSWPDEAQRYFAETGQIPGSIIATLGDADARPLRRICVETSERVHRPTLAAIPSPAPAKARAAIVIPTRDQPALLRGAIDSIRARTRPGSFEIVIVDNGSVTPEAKALLAELALAPDVLCLAHPSAFNFSWMCNRAVAASKGDVLLFLNDDTEVLSDGWLDRLMAHALDPRIGAVGARLTYPDGGLQHVGILAGMGESAGHFGALDAGDAPGWAGRNAVLHEVSAITGACLAVSRTKFEDAGGFDAENLPVELSDIDLCLKLGALGWQNVVDPAVHLMHRESASRGGATFRRLKVHANERAIFVERWRHVLRDDPVFHPGFSLYSWRAALG